MGTTVSKGRLRYLKILRRSITDETPLSGLRNFDLLHRCSCTHTAWLESMLDICSETGSGLAVARNQFSMSDRPERLQMRLDSPMFFMFWVKAMASFCLTCTPHSAPLSQFLAQTTSSQHELHIVSSHSNCIPQTFCRQTVIPYVIAGC